MIPKSKKNTGSSAVAIAVAVACALPGYAGAQTTTDEEIEEIVITGSRIKSGRQTASIPIDTVDASDIKLSGFQNVEEVLNNMPQFVPSRTASTNSTANPTATGAATLDLRGLGATRSLVLVNGRRYTFFDSSQTTDINNIPSSLIERVEVVTGGASAVYGSDAIAGVVNFILKDDFEGVELRTQFNQTTRGDGNITDINLTFGGNFADDRGNAVVSFNFLDRDSIFTTDRSFSADVLTDGNDANGNRTLVQGGSSFVPNGRFTGIPFSATDVAGIPGLEAALTAAGLAGLNNNGFTPDASGLNVRPFTRPGDLYNYTLDNFLRIPQERFAVTALAHLDISDTATGYFEGAFSHNRTETGFASSFINQSFAVEVANPFISPELSNVLQILDANEAGAGANDGRVNLGINRRLVELGPRRNEDTRNTFRTLFGVRGEVSEYEYNAYYSYARSDNTQIQKGNASRAAFATGILSGSGAGGMPALNPFGTNISADGVNFLGIETTNTEETELNVFGATITGDLFDMPAGPFAALIGTEWRSSSVVFNPDQSLLTGDVAGFNAITASEGEIDVWELFAEVSVPLLAGVAGVDSLSAKGAYRYSNYDLENTDGVSTFLFGLDWQVVPSVAFGAQFQRAIRAPSVGEAFGGQRSFPVGATDPCAEASAATDATVRDLCAANGVPAALIGDASIQPNNEIPGLFGGNPNLSEEESDTFTFSAIFTPAALPELRVSVDYFDIQVDDAIGLFGGSVSNVLNLCFDQIQDINSAACQAVGRNSNTGVIDVLNPVQVLNENIGGLETTGIDFKVSYAWDLDIGLIGINFAATLMDEYNLIPIADLPSVNECAGGFGRTCGEPKPDFKTNTSINWTSGDLTVGLRHRWAEATQLDDVILPLRRGVTTGPTPDSVAVFELDGGSYFDISFSYDFSEEFGIWGGVINVLDEDPPLLGSRQARANTRPDTFSPTGAEIFVGGSIKF